VDCPECGHFLVTNADNRYDPAFLVTALGAASPTNADVTISDFDERGTGWIYAQFQVWGGRGGGERR
jgi:hypothetical protein